MFQNEPPHNNNNGGQEHSPIDPTEHFSWSDTCGGQIPTMTQLRNLEHLCCIMEDIRSYFHVAPIILKCLTDEPGPHQIGAAINFIIPGQAPSHTLKILLDNKISFPFLHAHLHTDDQGITSVHMNISDSEVLDGQ